MRFSTTTLALVSKLIPLGSGRLRLVLIAAAGITVAASTVALPGTAPAAPAPAVSCSSQPSC